MPSSSCFLLHATFGPLVLQPHIKNYVFLKPIPLLRAINSCLSSTLDGSYFTCVIKVALHTVDSSLLFLNIFPTQQELGPIAFLPGLSNFKVLASLYLLTHTRLHFSVSWTRVGCPGRLGRACCHGSCEYRQETAFSYTWCGLGYFSHRICAPSKTHIQ